MPKNQLCCVLTANGLFELEKPCLAKDELITTGVTFIKRSNQTRSRYFKWRVGPAIHVSPPRDVSRHKNRPHKKCFLCKTKLLSIPSVFISRTHLIGRVCHTTLNRPNIPGWIIIE